MSIKSIEQMGGAPFDVQIYYDGDDTYFCFAIPGTWSSLSDAKFRVMKNTSSGGSLSKVRFARGAVGPKGEKIGGTEFELAATSLAVVKAYTYL